MKARSRIVAVQAEFAIELPDTAEPPPPLFIITAVWDGRGPMHGSRKIFTKPLFTLAAATAVAEKLKPEWKRRRIYQLA